MACRHGVVEKQDELLEEVSVEVMDHLFFINLRAAKGSSFCL